MAPMAARGYRNPEAVRAAVRALADLGIGIRETARLLHMEANHVHYYRKVLGLSPLEAVEIFAALPPDVQSLVIAARATSPTPLKDAHGHVDANAPRIG